MRKRDNPIAMAMNRLYVSAHWRRLRVLVLSAQPLCVICERSGRIVAATQVDHVTPHKGNINLFYDQSNLQPLCQSCHSKKTASEDGGFGNAHKTP